MSLYAKPAGYATISLTGVSRYRPFNNFLSGNVRYAPNRPTRLSVNLAFGATPANGSQIVMPIGSPANPTNLTLTFTYNGSPGPGIIPLVSGGGTAAQAATAAALAIAQQAPNWTANNNASANVILTANVRGVNLSPSLVGSTNITLSTLVAVTFRQVIPAILGKVFGWLTASPNTQQ